MNKTALITGASRGIGFEAAKKLIEAGWCVTGTARKSVFPDSLKNNLLFSGITASIENPKELEKLRSAVEDCDVLINNAGIFEPVYVEKSDKEWDKNWETTLQVNLVAPAKLSKWAIHSWLKSNKQGIVINVSSRASYRGETAEYSSYASSKAGLTALTKTIARGFGKKNILAYTIAPGFVNTDMAAGSVDVYGKEYITAGLALNDIVQPDETGELIATLASGVFPHMTGQTFHINSGSYMI